MGDTGNDTLDGGANYDLLVESANVDFTLTDRQLTGLGTDSITNIEAARLIGGVDNNLLDAGLVNKMNVTLVGGDGNDTLYSGSKADVLYGNLGNDRLESGGGWDRLNGNSGNDVLFAGDGNDTLNGSSGNDTLKGERGNDIIIRCN